MKAESLRQLIANCRRPDRRFLGFPRDWQPERVRNPEADAFFPYLTDTGAWELIARYLESGQPFQEIELKFPPGVLAIVFQIALEPGVPLVYVKIEIGKESKPIGRSFHYSDMYKGRPT